MIDKIINHINYDDFLDKKDIVELLSKYPDYEYNGYAYRVFVDKFPIHHVDIFEDISFSRSRSGIKYFLAKKDLDQLNYCKLFKVYIKGFDLTRFAQDFQIKGVDIIEQEQEVVCLDILETEILFEGSSLDLNI